MNAPLETRLIAPGWQQQGPTHEQFNAALAGTATALVAALESRDPYTAGHGFRVGEIAAAIGRHLGWDEFRVTGLRIAGMLHDIGKISVPAEILTKIGSLSAAEHALIREHSVTGYHILKKIPFLWPIAEITRQHHEKLDGSGYPRGLTAEQILPEAKILTVADIAEALGSDRPYRKAISQDDLITLLRSQAGTQLDFDAVEACTVLIEEYGLGYLCSPHSHPGSANRAEVLSGQAAD